MKKLLIIPFLLSSFWGFCGSIYVGPETEFLLAKEVGVKPGDTIFVMAGNRKLLHLARFKGKANKPIVVINYNGQVNINSPDNDGIKLNGCEHIIISGNGDAALEYGFKITASHAGIQAFGRSTHVEIAHIEISRANIGILLKSNDVSRGKFVQEQTIVHHNYIHHTEREGIYIGSSFFVEGKDHLLDGVWVYDNIFDHTGWDSLQVGSASQCKISGNHISRDSQLRETYQMGGISVNPGSDCDVYNNIISNGEGPGIIDQGNGGNMIYNNLIVRPGINGDKTQPRGLDGIIILGINREHSAGNSIYIYNNTIIEPKNNGISFGYDEEIQGDQSIIANNIIYKPGGLEFRRDAYIETMRNPAYRISNNIFTDDLKDILFSNFSADDFTLSSQSPAIDSGLNLSSIFNFDILYLPRETFDIGAYEKQ